MKKVFYRVDTDEPTLGQYFQDFLDCYPNATLEHLVVTPVVLTTKDRAVGYGSIFAVIEVPDAP